MFLAPLLSATEQQLFLTFRRYLRNSLTLTAQGLLASRRLLAKGHHRRYVRYGERRPFATTHSGLHGTPAILCVFATPMVVRSLHIVRGCCTRPARSFDGDTLSGFVDVPSQVLTRNTRGNANKREMRCRPVTPARTGQTWLRCCRRISPSTGPREGVGGSERRNSGTGPAR